VGECGTQIFDIAIRKAKITVGHPPTHCLGSETKHQQNQAAPPALELNLALDEQPSRKTASK
jgi:hypothetical protein